MTWVHHSLGTIDFHIFGSTDYFKKNKKPKDIDGLKDHTLIGYPANVPAPYEDPNWLFRKANVDIQNNPKLIQMNSQFGIYEAVKNGFGLAALPSYLFKDDKNIETCLDSTTRPSVTMYFVYMKERTHSTRIQLLKNFLLKQ